jgi:hypothetical protein
LEKATGVDYDMAKDWIAGTVDPDYKPSVSVDGVGRIGTPNRMRSRARHHWVVSFYDGTRSETGYEHKIADELGTFTKGWQAAEAAKKFADEKGWTVSDYVTHLIDWHNAQLQKELTRKQKQVL